MNEQHIIVDGKVLISEVKDLFGLHIEEDDVDTIGGWIMMQNHKSKKDNTLRRKVMNLKC